jgi:hypothetical protein
MIKNQVIDFFIVWAKINVFYLIPFAKNAINNCQIILILEGLVTMWNYL